MSSFSIDSVEPFASQIYLDNRYSVIGRYGGRSRELFGGRDRGLVTRIYTRPRAESAYKYARPDRSDETRTEKYYKYRYICNIYDIYYIHITSNA